MQEITREIITLRLNPKLDPTPFLRKLSGHPLFRIALFGNQGEESLSTKKGCPLCFLSFAGAETYLSHAGIDRSQNPAVAPCFAKDLKQSGNLLPDMVSLCALPPVMLHLSGKVFFKTFFPKEALTIPVPETAEPDTSSFLLSPLPSGGLFSDGVASTTEELQRAALFSFFPDLLEEQIREKNLKSVWVDQKLNLPAGTTRRIVNRNITRLSLPDLQHYLSLFELDSCLYLFSSHCPELRHYLLHKTDLDRYHPVRLKIRKDSLPVGSTEFLRIEEARDSRGYLYFLLVFLNLSDGSLRKIPVSFPFGLFFHARYRLDSI